MLTRNKFREHSVLLNFTLIFSIILSSCGYLPEEDRQVLEQLEQQVVSDLKDELGGRAAEGLESLTGEMLEQIKQNLPEELRDNRNLQNLLNKTSIGKTSIGINPLSPKPVIRALFIAAYLLGGQQKKLGDPEDLVNYWEGTNPRVLIQFFSGGSEGRSAIVMIEGEEKAYVLPGLWLQQYQLMGGPGAAGFPVSNLEDWKGGRRQLFVVDGREYALLKPKSIDRVFIVPPHHWDFYKTSAASQIGYPLSSYPLDESRWKDLVETQPTRDILFSWERQPFRMQIFEKGSLIWLKGRSQVEIIEAGPVSRLFNLGKPVLLAGVRRELGFIYDDFQTSSYENSCLENTIRHGANMAADRSGDILIPIVAWTYLKSVLVGSEILVESISGELMLAATNMLVEQAQGIKLKDSIGSAVAGFLLDSVYSKAIGDTLSTPLSEISVLGIEKEMEILSRDRIFEESDIHFGDRYGDFTADMDAEISIQYDPLTRILTGVIVSDCSPYGILFFYMVDPATGFIAKPTDVWDGKVHFIDLRTGENFELE